MSDFLKKYGNKLGPFISAVGAFLHQNPQYSLGPIDDLLIFLGGFIINLYGDRRGSDRPTELPSQEKP